jgi:hypothetical protein
LISSMKSSRHSGNSVDCPRSTPSTKRFIRSPANRAGILQRSAKIYHLDRAVLGLSSKRGALQLPS